MSVYFLQQVKVKKIASIVRTEPYLMKQKLNWLYHIHLVLQASNLPPF